MGENKWMQAGKGNNCERVTHFKARVIGFESESIGSPGIGTTNAKNQSDGLFEFAKGNERKEWGLLEYLKE